MVLCWLWSKRLIEVQRKAVLERGQQCLKFKGRTWECKTGGLSHSSRAQDRGSTLIGTLQVFMNGTWRPLDRTSAPPQPSLQRRSFMRGKAALQGGATTVTAARRAKRDCLGCVVRPIRG